MKIVLYMHIDLFEKVFTWQPDVGSVVNWNVLLFCIKEMIVLESLRIQQSFTT